MPAGQERGEPSGGIGSQPVVRVGEEAEGEHGTKRRPGSSGPREGEAGSGLQKGTPVRIGKPPHRRPFWSVTGGFHVKVKGHLARSDFYPLEGCLSSIAVAGGHPRFL